MLRQGLPRRGGGGSRPWSSPVETYLDRSSVRLEPFGAPERDRRGTEFGKFISPEPENRGPLHEIEHAEPRGKPRRARRRQHVVGSGHIIADRLGGVRAQEDRARVADLCREPLGVACHDLDVLRRDSIDQGHRGIEIAHQNDGAKVAPRPRYGRCGTRPPARRAGAPGPGTPALKPPARARPERPRRPGPFSPRPPPAPRPSPPAPAPPPRAGARPPLSPAPHSSAPMT